MTKAVKENQFIVSAGLVRIIAIMGVVALHVTDALINPANYFGGLSWWFANVINSFGRTAVPLFIMLSGFLILNPQKHYSQKQIFEKAIFRIGIPLIFWSIFYFLWRQRWWAEIISPGYVLEKVLSGRLFHLYFLVIIIGLYIITPPLKDLLNKSSKTQKRKMVIAGLLFAFTATAITYIFPLAQSLINVFTLFTLSIGYYLTGDYLRKINLSTKQAGFLLLSTLFLVFFTAFLNYQNRIFYSRGISLFWTSGSGQYFWEYASPNVILMSLALFTLLINTDKFLQIIKTKLIVKMIKYFSATAFGIYIIHPFIIDLLDHFARMAIHLISSNLWFYILKKILLVFLISHITVWFMSKITLVKKLVGEN